MARRPAGLRGFLLALGICCAGLPAEAMAADPVSLLAATAPVEHDLGDGARLLLWRIADRAGAVRPLELVVAVLPGGAAHWRVLPVDAAGPRADLLAGLDCPDGALLTSGGFFVARDEGGFAPLGLAVGDGVELSPFAPRRWGGILVRRGPASAIVPLAAWQAPDGAGEALQSSPIVVAEGRNDMLRDDGRLDNRLAVGLDGRGGMVVVGAFRGGGGAVSLHGLAELILALEPAAGIAVDGALALDGGSSAQILAPGEGLAWGSPLPGYMPNALCFATDGG